jgi:dynein heavy chain 1
VLPISCYCDLTFEQIDRLSLEGYANLEIWVDDLDARIETILLDRLDQVITLFGNKMAGQPTGELSGHFDFPPLVHEVRIQNQFIYLDPPVEHAKATWYGVIQGWLAVVCNLTRIQASRYETGLKIQTASPSQTTYSTLVCDSRSLGLC